MKFFVHLFARGHVVRNPLCMYNLPTVTFLRLWIFVYICYLCDLMTGVKKVLYTTYIW